MGLLYGRRRGSSRVWLDFARIVSYNILAWIPRVSAVSAALAEELGTDITGIRIVSMKKV